MKACWLVISVVATLQWLLLLIAFVFWGVRPDSFMIGLGLFCGLYVVSTPWLRELG
jgi:hypothetical protein